MNTETVCNAIRFAWEAAHSFSGPDDHLIWLSAWDTVHDKLSGMWQLVLYSGESVEQTESLREEINFLRDIAYDLKSHHPSKKS